MRRSLLLLVTVAAAFAWACDVTAPMGPDPSAPQLARVAVPAVVPIGGEAAIAVDPTGGLLPCIFFGTDVVVAEFPARFTSEGRFSHMGRTSSSIEVLSCVANPDGTITGPGRAVHTAANGDELHASFTGLFRADGSSDLWIEFTGGTGRFDGATGEATGGGSSDPATFVGTWWFEGTISRVGAK